MTIKKTLLSIIYGVAVIALALEFAGFNTATQAESSDSSGPEWENLKVLPQDISKDSLMNLMEGYTIALAVKCSYCHVPRKDNPEKMDFASDDKIEKEIARGMITMTREINENYFKPHFPDPKPETVEVVNCVLCHRGTSNPELYLSKMGSMYKTYQEGRDNRKEMILEQMGKK